MLRPLFFATGVFAVTFAVAQTNPQNVTGAYFGAPIATPKLGYNAYVANAHDLPNCNQPDTTFTARDWRRKSFRNHIATLEPEILRFPGGTAANYWYWADETKTVLNQAGQPVSLQICEGTFINTPWSLDIGCAGDLIQFSAEDFTNVATKTTTTLDSYLDMIDEFRNERGIPVQEMFVLSMADPFYYVNSPLLEYEFGHLSNAGKRQQIATKGVQRAIRQVNILLKTYCDNCTSYDGEILFELSNEGYLNRYGKFYPQLNCFAPGTTCDQCPADANLYSDMSAVLIPIIRQKFPNAKISLAAGRLKVGGIDWNAVLRNRFEPGNTPYADAVSIHFYPRALPYELLTPAMCQAIPGPVNTDLVIAEQSISVSYFMERRGFSVYANSPMDVWITEFNSHNELELCEQYAGVPLPPEASNFYLRNWLHILHLFNMLNAMMTYSTNLGDPWFGYGSNVGIDTYCLHSMFGNPGISAIEGSFQLSSSGIMMNIVSQLAASSTSVRKMVLAGNINTASLSADGSIPQSQVGNINPVKIVAQPTAYNVITEPVDLPGAMGWAFQGPNPTQFLMVNMRNVPLQVNLSHLPNIDSQVSVKSYSVNAANMVTLINEGFESSHIIKSENFQPTSSITLPAYGVVVVTAEVPAAQPCFTQNTTPLGGTVSCGLTQCPPCDCTFTNWNTATFETGMGIWANLNPTVNNVNIAPLPPMLQSASGTLGAYSLRMNSGAPFASIVTPVVNTSALARIRVRFNYGSIGLLGNADRIVLSYSSDGGTTFTSLTSWQHNVHFNNNQINEAIFVSALPVGPQTQFRIQARMDGIGKMVLVDNIELAYCTTVGGSMPPSMPQAITSQAENLDVQLYPNPSRDMVNVMITGDHEENVFIEMLTATGARVGYVQASVQPGQHNETIQVSHLPAGMYFIRVSTSGTTTVKKFVRQP